jgi:hypothetical protein
VPYKAPGTDYHRYVGIYQRLYYDRVLLCGQFIDDSVANNIMSILWYLHKEDRNKPIYMYVRRAALHTAVVCLSEKHDPQSPLRTCRRFAHRSPVPSIHVLACQVL